MTVMQRAARKAWKTRRANMAALKVNAPQARPPLVELLRNERRIMASKVKALEVAIAALR